MTITTSMSELESLFGPIFDEYFNGENQVVLKSSVVTDVDASNKHQQQPDSTSSTLTLATTVTADGNFDLSLMILGKFEIIRVAEELTGPNRYPVSTSLIHIETCKSPTVMLFDVDTGRISIRQCWIGLHKMAMAAFKSQYIDTDTYSVFVVDIEVTRVTALLLELCPLD
ncbi:hypothetical protein Tco_1508106 [Tanacetum coccineum]